MHSLSLLSYSLSYPNSNRGHTTSEVVSGPTIVLPPIHNAHSWSKPRQQVLHPKISTVFRPPVVPSNKSPIELNTTHPCTQPLTEHNLSVRNNVPNYATGIPSPPKSILLVGLVLPALLPVVTKAELNVMGSAPAYEYDLNPAAFSSSVTQPSALGKKRRQRLGPSCDLCRQRKVKCNAEISIVLTIAEDFATHCKQFQLLAAAEAALWAGSSVEIERGIQLVVQNEKLVKFRLCKLCEVKQLACCFLKGFTKDDIVSLSKKNITGDNKVVKPVSGLTKVDRCRTVAKKPVKFDSSLNRKSSCALCRQRKVKCLYSEALGRCENCHRKNKSCLFDC